jgi:uncharacterized protein YbjT (DUF2867 family)
MNVLLFGATGMVGQGVLRECLLDSGVKLVQTIGRAPTGKQHPKLQEIILEDLFDYSSVTQKLEGFDACFFCLGVTSTGMSEEAYERITYGITMAAAKILVGLNSQMTFIYVSGQSTDSTEQGRIMWARIKGRTENALSRLPFKATYAFRPGIIQPLDGITSKTISYRILYSLTGPLLPLLHRLFPDYVLTTQQIGRAMLAAVRQGYPKRVLESSDIRVLSESTSPADKYKGQGKEAFSKNDH